MAAPFWKKNEKSMFESSMKNLIMNGYFYPILSDKNCASMQNAKMHC